MNQNDTLSYDDRILIDKIIIGCAILISDITSNDKNYARVRSNQQAKSLVNTWILINLPLILEKKLRFRPSDIRKMLPENEIMKNIQSADLTDILNSLVTAKILIKVDKEEFKKETKQKKWGRQPKGDNDTDESGPKSFYEPSSYYNDLKILLAKPEARDVIYTSLLQSNLLYKLEKYLQTQSLRITRNNVKKIAWNILNSVNLAPMKRESDFEADHRKIVHIDDNKRLKSITEKETIHFIKKHNANDYAYIYYIGGIYFHPNVQELSRFRLTWASTVQNL
jgi:hypothetical protein